jgi:hypothetical protein
MAFERKMQLFVGVFKDAAMMKAVTGEDNLQEGYLVDDLDYEFDITCSTEFIRTKTAAAWRAEVGKGFTIGKRPCVFILLS